MKKMKLFCTLALAMSVVASIPAMANWNKGQGENDGRWWYGYEVMQNPDGFGLTETETELPSATILMMQVGP